MAVKGYSITTHYCTVTPTVASSLGYAHGIKGGNIFPGFEEIRGYIGLRKYRTIIRDGSLLNIPFLSHISSFWDFK